MFNKYKGKTVVDGSIKGYVPYKYEFSKKIFINAMPKWTRKLSEIKS